MNKGKLKSNKGITLVTLIITIVVIFIVAGTTVYTSLDRFEINRYNKMKNDLELLSDKVANYYLKYNSIPVVRDETNSPILYPIPEFDKNVNDNENYYIIDLSAMEGISLNYGKEGFNNPNASDDVYIINESSHQIYYVKGIEVKGVIYHTLENNNTLGDNIPPTKPEIKIISGDLNSDGKYTSDVEIEIIPGRDNWSGVNKTTYSINDGTETVITTLENNILNIAEDGTYIIKARSYDKNGNWSEMDLELVVAKIVSTLNLNIGDFIEYNISYVDTMKYYYDNTTYTYSTKNGWRIIDYTDNGDGTYTNVKLISTGIPAMFYYNYSDTTNNGYFITDSAELDNFREILGGSSYNLSNTTSEFYSLEAAAGLYSKFESIMFSYGTSTSVGVGKGYLYNITSNNIVYNSKNTVEVSGGNLFNLYPSKAKVRILTMPEINKYINRKTGNDIDVDNISKIETTQDVNNIYRLDQLYLEEKMENYTYSVSAEGSWWVASPYPNSDTELIYINPNGTISKQNNNKRGIRPVICFTSNVEFIDTDKDGILEIKN